MGKIDEVKEEINWLGRIFSILIVTAFALMGWFVLNYQTADFVVLLVCFLAILFLSIAIYIINRYAIKKIRELKGLKK